VELAERNMKRPLVLVQLAKAVEGKIDTLADADSGSADEQQSIALQVVGVAEFPIQPLIVLGRKWFGQVVGEGRKILRANEAGLEGMAVVSQAVKQMAEP
jgi:hypothetical protein